MSIFLKPLEQQVVVITGASSGIGLATAEAAAIRGAQLVLAARSERVLSDTVAPPSVGRPGCATMACGLQCRTR
jgi:NADP-dependent 3-hydroxy acid dehydrogenase YdfG